MSDHGEPTIAAIATPPGPGGIGIIRISGPASQKIFTKLFKPKSQIKKIISHRLYYGWIIDPESKEPVDEVLAVLMKAPHTYTRLDVVEIHCHGSYIVLQEILGLVLNTGAILAQPGEFTKCAFLNGRIDLTQAEAVLELLKARTKEGHHLAINQLQGQLHNTITSVCNSLVSIKAVVEVAIDFPEDDIEIVNPHSIQSQLSKEVLPVLENLISRADSGKIFREGIAVVIIGRPNVGKSSMLNALLKEERAIVTPVPGTTRDTIEEYLNIQGIPVRIIDTAGIRNDADTVEEMGILRTRKKLEQADLVLLMLDLSENLTDEDVQLFGSAAEKPVILVANKTDIGMPGAQGQISHAFPGQKFVAVSAKTGQGINILEEVIFTQVTDKSPGWDPGSKAVPNLRHKVSMINALDACLRISAGLKVGLSPDLLAIELQSALDHLGDIVGHTSTDDVLDKIFREFCIGK